MTLPLAGVRVLDFTWVMAGPQCNQVLADLGAEVLKVEWPYNPDGIRFTVKVPDAPPDSLEHGGVFNNLNRNKRSVTLNMRHPDAREIALKLIAKSDVVIENFTPGVLESWGMGWETMKETNPGLVYLSMTGFGRGGPNERYVVFGPVMHAVSGLMGMTGSPGSTPSGLGWSYADHVGGYFGALAVVYALHERDATGKGSMIDLSQTEGAVAVTSAAILDYEVNNRTFSNWGNVPFGSSDAPAGLYRCSGTDQWCAISVRNDEQWQAFTKAAGLDELRGDERLATVSGREAHRAMLDREVGAWAVQRERDEIVSLLSEAGVPATPLLNIEELIQHPALRQRGYFQSATHPLLGEREFQMGAIKSDDGPELRSAAPLMGEGNQYVYGEILGMSDSEIAAYRDDIVI